MPKTHPGEFRDDVVAVGVFTINAKYHRGAHIWVAGNTLMVNGTRYPYIRMHVTR